MSWDKFRGLFLGAMVGLLYAMAPAEAQFQQDSDQIYIPPQAVEPAGTLGKETCGMAGADSCGLPDERVGCSAKERGCCDEEKKAELEKKAAGAYQGLYFLNDFRYLEDPCYDEYHLGEELKRLEVGQHTKVDVGGEYRLRLHIENNMRGLGLTGRDDEFLLRRLRLYTNVEMSPWFRLYGEMLDARSDFEDFAPRPIEENEFELQNLFAEVRLFENEHGTFSARIGRQELLYGAQRLVSPLDWANTRRTFQGAKFLWQGDHWSIDGFWVEPVLLDTQELDATDENSDFFGIYSTRKIADGETLDLYWLALHDDRANFPDANRFGYHTIGARWKGSREGVLFEFEGAYQFGDFDEISHAAGFFTLGLGHKFDKLSGDPTLWFYYDWASGDELIGNGFNQFFPLAHKWLGLMDFFGRNNIEDFNLLLTTQLHERVKLLTWLHVFYLQRADDVPYTVVNTPIVPVAGGSEHLGQELDMILSVKISDRSDILFGYSHFFSGDWYRTNPVQSTRFSDDADFFYTQCSVRF